MYWWFHFEFHIIATNKWARRTQNIDFSCGMWKWMCVFSDTAQLSTAGTYYWWSCSKRRCLLFYMGSPAWLGTSVLNTFANALLPTNVVQWHTSTFYVVLPWCWHAALLMHGSRYNLSKYALAAEESQSQTVVYKRQVGSFRHINSLRQ